MSIGSKCASSSSSASVTRPALSSRLALITLRGDGVTSDPQRAETLLKQAIAAGDVKWGAFDLGDLYRADTALRSLPDAAKAYELSAKAEAAGYDLTPVKAFLGR